MEMLSFTEELLLLLGGVMVLSLLLHYDTAFCTYCRTSGITLWLGCVLILFIGFTIN